MVIDISEQILWFRRVTHEDCARADGMKGGRRATDGRAECERTDDGEGGGGNGTF